MRPEAGVPGPLGRVVRLVRVVRGRKREVVRRLSDGTAPRAGGWWRVGLDEARVLALPRPGRRGGGLVADHAAGPARSRPLRWAVRLVPPLVVRRPGPRDVGGVHLLVTKSGGAVLLDPGAGVVVHERAVPFDAAYPGRREAVAAYLPVRPGALSADRRVLREPLVAGRPLHRAPVAARRAVLRDVAARSAAAAGTGRPGGATAAVAAAVDAALAAAPRLPADLVAALRADAPALRDAAATWPAVVAHGDLTGENVLLADDGTWGLVDLEDARPLPWFADALSLLLRDPDLGPAWAAGREPDLLAPLRLPGVAPDERTWGRAAALLAAAHHAGQHGGDVARTLPPLWR